MNSGFIRLYFDGNLVTTLKFNSVELRKEHMKKLNELYQLNRQRKIVYYELTSK